MITARAIIRLDPNPTTPIRYTVDVAWDVTGVVLDRPISFGMGCGSNLQLAERFAAAVNAQAAFTDIKVINDCNGKSLVSANCKIMGRHLNTDLKKLGY